MFYICSLQDRRGNTGDPETQGGSVEGERGAAEKAGDECCSEEGETRREQVSLPRGFRSPPSTFHFSFWSAVNIVLPNRKKSLEGIKRKFADAEEDSEVEDPGKQDDRPAPVESDDEAEYYRQAVGQEPDEGQ